MALEYLALTAAIKIDSTNNTIAFLEGASARTATIASGEYFLRGDLSATDFCAAVATALNSAPGVVNTYSVTLTTDGTTPSLNLSPASSNAIVRVARATGASTFKIQWTSVTTKVSAFLGFSVEKGAADNNPELSTKSPSTLWLSNDVYTRIRPNVNAIGNGVFTADGNYNHTARGGVAEDIETWLEYVAGARMFYRSNTTNQTSTFESFFSIASQDGRKIERHILSLQSVSGTLLTAMSTTTREVSMNGSTSWCMAPEYATRLTADEVDGITDYWNFSFVMHEVRV